MGRLVTTNEDLVAACQRFEGAPYIAVDTEFMRDTTYWPRLCLLQAAIPGFAVAIDPLAPGLDMKPFYALMARTDSVKVFHAARQDIEIFYHQAGVIPAPLFDTQVAAMVCGFGESVAYETLVRELASVQVDKSSRFTDWARRPLTDRQVDYALSDVIHLCRVYEALARQLEKNQRSDWMQQELDTLRATETYDLKPEDAWRRLKLRSGNRRFTAVLMEIAAWRERQAQERNVPRSRIMKDDALFEIASQAPVTTEDLDNLRGIPRGFATSKGAAGVLQAVKAGLALPPSAVPDIERGPSVSVPPVLGDMMRVLLKILCEQHGVAQKLIASSSDLDQIAADDNADVPALSGWRREIFGSAALDLKHGRIALTIRNRKPVVVAAGS